jgi:DNA polymerase III epsilon subunit-like protein
MRATHTVKGNKMKRLIEDWREKLIERTPPSAPFYKGELEQVKQRMLSHGTIYVFFDTETTGLSQKDPTTQVTQISATTYDCGDWLKGTGDAKRVDESRLNIKLTLKPLVAKTMEKQDRFMNIQDKSDPAHAEYANEVMSDIRKLDPTKQRKKINGLVFRSFENDEEALDMDKPEDRKRFGMRRKELIASPASFLPLYRDAYTDDPHQMTRPGQPGPKGTLRALLNLGRYYNEDSAIEADYKHIGEFYQPTEQGLDNLSSYLKEMSKYGQLVITAQNAPFDVRQMKAEYAKYDKELPLYNTFDTLKFFQFQLAPVVKKFVEEGNSLESVQQHIVDTLSSYNSKGDLKVTSSLGPVIKAFDIEDLGWHDALADSEMTFLALKAVMEFLENYNKSQSTEPAEEPMEIPSDVAVTAADVPGLENINESIKKLQEEWNYALTRKQRELIEREILSLKKKL